MVMCENEYDHDYCGEGDNVDKGIVGEITAQRFAAANGCNIGRPRE